MLQFTGSDPRSNRRRQLATLMGATLVIGLTAGTAVSQVGGTPNQGSGVLHITHQNIQGGSDPDPSPFPPYPQNYTPHPNPANCSEFDATDALAARSTYKMVDKGGVAHTFDGPVTLSATHHVVENPEGSWPPDTDGDALNGTRGQCEAGHNADKSLNDLGAAIVGYKHPFQTATMTGGTISCTYTSAGFSGTDLGLATSVRWRRQDGLTDGRHQPDIHEVDLFGVCNLMDAGVTYTFTVSEQHVTDTGVGGPQGGDFPDTITIRPGPCLRSSISADCTPPPGSTTTIPGATTTTTIPGATTTTTIDQGGPVLSGTTTTSTTQPGLPADQPGAGPPSAEGPQTVTQSPPPVNAVPPNRPSGPAGPPRPTGSAKIALGAQNPPAHNTPPPAPPGGLSSAVAPTPVSGVSSGAAPVSGPIFSPSGAMVPGGAASPGSAAIAARTPAATPAVGMLPQAQGALDFTMVAHRSDAPPVGAVAAAVGLWAAFVCVAGHRAVAYRRRRRWCFDLVTDAGGED